MEPELGVLRIFSAEPAVKKPTTKRNTRMKRYVARLTSLTNNQGIMAAREAHVPGALGILPT